MGWLHLFRRSSPDGGAGPCAAWWRGTGRKSLRSRSGRAEDAPPRPFGWSPARSRGGLKLLGRLIVPAVFAAALFGGNALRAAGEEVASERDYSRVIAPPAPAGQTIAEVSAKSDACYSCHVRTDAPTMHESPAVRLGCTDCHGGDATVMGNSELPHDHPDYVAARERAHVLPKYPESWHYPSSANPKQSYALLNREAPEFIRFVNPSDYRVAREACGACHLDTIEAGERSLMATGAMFFG